mmetsp:Transcript_18660/g.41523  ORF Transcript_18660/g.41523 Transcript_18660/m.41523 type:complete len:118 (+) Transcript_18660:46-399(+)
MSEQTAGRVPPRETTPLLAGRDHLLDDGELIGDLEEDIDVAATSPTGGRRRWSVLEKLNNRYYCRIRSCHDCARNMTYKCMFATLMLVAFSWCAVHFARELICNIEEEVQKRALSGV